jgi:ADP-ribose pyrophosphatase YjhB (NUDIX family)
VKKLKGKDKYKSRLIICQPPKILLLKKHGEKIKYSLVGGFVDVGETPKQGLIREAFEEVGLEITTDELHLLSKIRGRRTKNLVKYYYYLNNFDKPYELKETHKFSDFLWIDLTEALKYLEGTDRAVVKLHFFDDDF